MLNTPTHPHTPLAQPTGHLCIQQKSLHLQDDQRGFGMRPSLSFHLTLDYCFWNCVTLSAVGTTQFVVFAMAHADEDKYILQYSKRLPLPWAAGEADGRLAIDLSLQLGSSASHLERSKLLTQGDKELLHIQELISNIKGKGDVLSSRTALLICPKLSVRMQEGGSCSVILHSYHFSS